MKKLYILLFALSLGFSGSAQVSELGKANKLFRQRAYIEASEHYRLVSNKTQEVLENLGDSYFFTNRMENAEDTYRLLFTKYQNVDPIYKFRLAHALRATGDTEDADYLLSDYLGREVNFEAWRSEIDTTAVHTYRTKQVMNSGSSASNFGITYFGDKVVFASTRNEERPIYAWNEKPYLDLYIADFAENGELSNIELFPGEINTDTHESSATFNEAGDVMYFDRTNEERVKVPGSRVPVAHVSIFRAELVDGEWTNVTRVPFASDEFSTEHPTLSKDGSTLYFASDMPGSLGSFDIYKVDVNEDGTFGEPVNLGTNVNTAHREQFPYISEEDVLYFSSNGRIGFGNLDLYRAEIEDGLPEEAENLGNTINSPLDEFGYVLREGEEKGFFASNRRGSDNLYIFEREDYEKPVLPTEEMEINPETGRRQIANVSNIYFEFDKAVIKPESEPVLNRVVEIMQKYPELKIEIGAHADARGTDQYNFDLSQRRAEATLEYLVAHGISRDRLIPKGYGEEVPLNDCTEPNMCTEEQYARNRRSEFTEVDDENPYFQNLPEAEQEED